MILTTHKTPLFASEKAPGATRNRVLDVAEQLFAERGLHAVSIRDITRAAGVNLGAINYHFGSKERLIGAVFERRIAPISEERLRALEAAEKTAGDVPPTLEAVLDAMFRPTVEQAMDPERGGATFGKLMVRCFVEPHTAVEEVMRRYLDPVVRRFDTVLMCVKPNLTAEDVLWRMHLLIGALHQSLLLWDRTLPDGRTLRMEPETYLKRFLAFAKTAFHASIPEA